MHAYRKDTEEQITTLTALLSKAKKRKVQLKKAHRVLVGGSARNDNGKTAPNLTHVAKGIRLAFKGIERLSPDQLEKRVVEILKAQDGLSEQGLKLRVQQGLAKLTVDGDGYVTAPSSVSQSERRSV